MSDGAAEPEDSADEGWELYPCWLVDDPAWICVNLGLRRRAPLSGRPWWVSCRLMLDAPRDDGLASDDEHRQLMELEDAVVEYGTQEGNMTYVGRITARGVRTLCFYAADRREALGALEASGAHWPRYRFVCSARQDAGWTGYFDLLVPSSRDWRCILNRRQLEGMRAQGGPRGARPIRHRGWVPVTADVSALVSDLAGRGFEVVAPDVVDLDAPARRRWLTLQRTDVPDTGPINDVTLELMDLLEDRGGGYEGWTLAEEVSTPASPRPAP